MEPQQPSRTAFGAALHRAAHQMLDRPPVLDDPLAIRIVGQEGEALLRGGEQPISALRSPALRAFIAARSRYTEDGLTAARNRGVGQYVLLGAGLDTFACRIPPGDALAIFEVDHPATQAWKQACLARTGLKVPPAVRFAPVDFESETLAEGLARAAFDRGKPAYFTWLGVVPYLTAEAVRATLGFIASLPAGSEVVFDYAEAPTQEADSKGLIELAARVAAAGEPLRSFQAPDTLARDLLGMGFSAVEDLDRNAINTRYFDGRSDGLYVRGLGHLLKARV